MAINIAPKNRITKDEKNIIIDSILIISDIVQNYLKQKTS